MKAESFIADNPPSDGRDWDCQCARCGSSVHWETCGACGGEGITAPGELYEEDPLWYAAWGICMSSPEWCEAHPLTGRDAVKRGAIEWFTFDAPTAPAAVRNAEAPAS